MDFNSAVDLPALRNRGRRCKGQRAIGGGEVPCGTRLGAGS